MNRRVVTLVILLAERPGEGARLDKHERERPVDAERGAEARPGRDEVAATAGYDPTGAGDIKYDAA